MTNLLATVGAEAEIRTDAVHDRVNRLVGHSAAVTLSSQPLALPMDLPPEAWRTLTLTAYKEHKSFRHDGVTVFSLVVQPRFTDLPTFGPLCIVTKGGEWMRFTERDGRPAVEKVAHGWRTGGSQERDTVLHRLAATLSVTVAPSYEVSVPTPRSLKPHLGIEWRLRRLSLRLQHSDVTEAFKQLVEACKLSTKRRELGRTWLCRTEIETAAVKTAFDQPLVTRRMLEAHPEIAYWDFYRKLVANRVQKEMKV